MVKLGYSLITEEHGPNELIQYARRAEDVGFDFALVSDHFHPWIGRQGQSPFAWSVLGGIAQATESIAIGTAVTCPIIRYHPAVVAQAAATVGAMMEGRFFLGVGTGEKLNEHVTGERWPSASERLEMLEEAIDIIRSLWQGGIQTFNGQFFHVEDAELYTLPQRPIPVVVAASGQDAAQLAGEFGDGLIATSAEASLVETFTSTGGNSKPRYGQVSCCWNQSRDTAMRLATQQWPLAGLPGALHQELALPGHFEQAADLVTEDAISAAIPCGPDPEPYIEKIQAYIDAGFDHVSMHQVGPEQEGFFTFVEREVFPHVRL